MMIGIVGCYFGRPNPEPIRVGSDFTLLSYWEQRYCHPSPYMPKSAMRQVPPSDYQYRLAFPLSACRAREGIAVGGSVLTYRVSRGILPTMPEPPESGKPKSAAVEPSQAHGEGSMLTNHCAHCTPATGTVQENLAVRVIIVASTPAARFLFSTEQMTRELDRRTQLKKPTGGCYGPRTCLDCRCPARFRGLRPSR